MQPKPPVPKKLPTPPPPPPQPVEAPPSPDLPAKKAAARRQSTSVPTIRRSETTETARPKREIHPPPPKDLPYADAPKKHRAARKSKHSDGSAEQLKFCGKVLSDLHKKSHWNAANPFYEPVGKLSCNRINSTPVLKMIRLGSAEPPDIP